MVNSFIQIFRSYKKAVIGSVLLLFVGLIFSASSTVFASSNENTNQRLNQVQLDKLQIQSQKNEQGVLLTGSIEIKNPNSYLLNKIFLQAEVLKENTETDGLAHGHIIEKTIISDYLNLSSGETINQPISIQLGNNYYDGNYYVTISAYDQTSLKVGTKVAQVELTGGDSSLLAIDTTSAFLLQGADRLAPLTGTVIKEDSSYQLTFTVQNRGTKDVQFKPHIEIYSRGQYPDSKPYKSTDFTQDVIQVSQSKVINLALPKIEFPESYLVKLHLENDANQKISTLVYYRFVISGEGGKIISSRVETNQHWFNEVVAFRNTIVGPADTSELSNVTIRTTIREGEKTLSTTTKNIEKIGVNPIDVIDSVSLSAVPFKSENDRTMVVELISSSDRVLHSVTLPIQSDGLPATQVNTLKVAILVVLLAILGGAGWLLWKRFGNKGFLALKRNKQLPDD